MKLKFFLFLLFTGLGISQATAQKQPEISIIPLENNTVSKVNLTNKTLFDIQSVTLEMKKQFIEFDSQQKLAVMLIIHKTGSPTIEVYSNPKITEEKEQQFFEKVNKIGFANTNIVDFSVLITLNVKENEWNQAFTTLITPKQKARKEFTEADLKQKVILLKNWATTLVIPVLTAYQTSFYGAFSPIKNFGDLVEKTDISASPNIFELTSHNPDYWGACMELQLGNQLIPLSKTMMLVANGEFDHAMRYLDILVKYSNPITDVHPFIDEFSWKLDLLIDQASSLIAKGIVEHDKGNLEQAIVIYEEILAVYPNSAWAWHELYLSKNALDIKHQKITAIDNSQWQQAKIKIYACDPMYHVALMPVNAKEAYLAKRRLMPSEELFKKPETRLKDVFEYGNIALDLEVYDFAAQLFLISYRFSNGENKEALHKYLFCLDKLDVKTLKQNFDGDFEKIFKEIETKQEKEMKNSTFYKSFKQ